MTITNDQITFVPSDFTALSTAANNALQAQAQQTNITTVQLVSGAMTDFIAKSVQTFRDTRTTSVKDVALAYANATPAQQASIKTTLGL